MNHIHPAAEIMPAIQPHHATDAAGVTHYYPGTRTAYAPLWPILAINPDGTRYSLYDVTPDLEQIVSRAAKRSSTRA